MAFNFKSTKAPFWNLPADHWVAPTSKGGVEVQGWFCEQQCRPRLLQTRLEVAALTLQDSYPLYATPHSHLTQFEASAAFPLAWIPPLLVSENISENSNLVKLCKHSLVHTSWFDALTLPVFLWLHW